MSAAGAQPREIQRGCRERLPGVTADLAEQSFPPGGGRGRDLVGSARHEVPPHEQWLAQRNAAEQEQPGLRLSRDGNVLPAWREVQQVARTQFDPGDLS